jgi:hypothetical protein
MRSQAWPPSIVDVLDAVAQLLALQHLDPRIPIGPERLAFARSGGRQREHERAESGGGDQEDRTAVIGDASPSTS